MGFTSVYRSLTQIFPQVDARMLRAVAIEHPKDPDEAASVVLSEILPSLPTDSTQSLSKSSPSIPEREVERDLEDVVSKYHHDGLLVASASKSTSVYSSSSSETIPLVTGRGHDDTSAPSTLPNVGPGVVCHKDVESEEQVQSLGKAPGQELGSYDFFGKCFDVPILPPPQIDLLHVTEDDLASVFPAVPRDGVESTRDFWQKLGFHMTWNQAEDSITSIGSLNAAEKGSCFQVGTGSTHDQSSKSSVTSVNGDAEVGGAFSSSTHGCSVDHLEEIIEYSKTNKKTLLALMDSVTSLMKEVELEEKDAEKSELEAARGGLDTLEKVEEFKKMLKHAKEANDINAGEVYGEKSILATEAKELENRLLNLSEERNKSLAVLDEMRVTLEIRLAAALEMKKAAEQEKKAKEDSALKALAEQEAIMEKVVQESKLLQQEAEQNSKLREFLMDRGQVVDSLQGEISVICQDVKLLKEKFDNGVSIPKKAATSSLTSSCGSSMRSLVLETPAEPLNVMLETSSSKNKSPEEEEASSTMNKLKNDYRELLEDGWDIFDKEIEL
ncbi:uncharacterized protein LOC106423059 isoform X1 [Brassica napus]|uniref:uncharacterized protein LOC106423059 isoform X1 n=2 Tax=Brassica napus TaxID=3708 RepID=UPI0006AA76BE|nr:uncharacterized protein LOC106423059 isoform X1 [Brassica napus]XP_048599327.1 uncharacterized protein LOC106423059 isoform X1 [Brassica napus]XP_048599328.1 uncharacterized protein LOC106423059 isoform X1 [Brassica napus]XP_048599329.1 uncharacterized protein LOC106423059 isoform X1 [Brassica napus]XP_048599330.1 uncharacterized protein LOC106423059 isoform X1 [Brassica napus]XP_048599331.1 uncharacterized protein LOC106423059 isoform X1 [Brassica napus]